MSTIPLWIKISYTVFAVITVVVYVVKYPLGNFLWFSDIALVLTVPALWFESSLIAGTLTVGVLLPEAFWNLGYFWRLLTGKRLAGLTDYMFDAQKPLYLRALSLFHVFLPLLLLWLVFRLGYARDAFIAMTALSWVVLPLTYGFVDPALNVNGVHGDAGEGRRWMPPRVRLGLLMLGYPALIYLPTHMLLQALFN
jgi:hypothetical protein